MICSLLPALSPPPSTPVRRDDDGPEAVNLDLAQYAVTTALASLPPGGVHDPLMVLECPQVLLVHYTDVGGEGGGCRVCQGEALLIKLEI